MTAHAADGLWLPAGATQPIQLRTIRTDATLLAFMLRWNARPAERLELSAREPPYSTSCWTQKTQQA